MSRDRYRIYETTYPYFITCTIVEWLPIFTRPETTNIILDSWRFLQERNRMVIYGYVILENHLHFIASSPHLAKEIGDFKSFTARKIMTSWNRAACGRCWSISNSSRRATRWTATISYGRKGAIPSRFKTTK